MSYIFSTETKTTTRPRHDATIRIQYLGPDDTRWGGQWRTVQLYEFHPDYDPRGKFRSYAFTPIPADLIKNGCYHTGVYTIMGKATWSNLTSQYVNSRYTRQIYANSWITAAHSLTQLHRLSYILAPCLSRCLQLETV